MGFARHKRQLAPGTIISDRYQVVRRIGSGGMGTVYEVRHRRLDRAYAAKVLAHDLSNDYLSLARFRREAEIISALRHPNIVDIVDWDNLDDGTPCIVMEYLRGESLADRIESQGALPWPDVLALGQQMLSGLATAHRERVVHRDLKPDNIFLARSDDGLEVAKLLDFGVSKIRDTNTLATQDTALLGTPAYMSPEQAESRASEIDETTDLWAMGAILYEMATGITAFDAASVPSLLYKVCHSDPAPIAEHRPDVPSGFQQVIAVALCRERAGRFASADDMNRALTLALSQSGHYSTGAMAQLLPAGYFDARPNNAQPLDAQYGTFSEASGQSHGAVAERSHKRIGLSVLVAVVLLAVGLGVGLFVARGGSEPSSPHPASAVSEGPDRPAASGSVIAADAGVAAAATMDASAAASERAEAKRRSEKRRSNKRHAKKRHKKRRSKKPASKVKPADAGRKKGQPVNPFGDP